MASRRAWLSSTLTGMLLTNVLRTECVWAERPLTWPYEYEAGQFKIHTDFQISADDGYIAELDRLNADVSELLSLKTSARAIHIVLFGSQVEYRRYMSHYFPKLPERRALYIQDRGPGMVFAHRHSDLAVDLRHESAHALLNESVNTLPLWLDEGLAEYFEVPEAQRLRGHSHLRSLSVDTLASVPQLTSLESLGDISRMSNEHYCQAWAWTHFLLHRHRETRDLLVRHIAKVRSGESTEPLSQIVKRQIPAWQAAFCDHFRQLI